MTTEVKKLDLSAMLKKTPTTGGQEAPPIQSEKKEDSTGEQKVPLVGTPIVKAEKTETLVDSEPAPEKKNSPSVGMKISLGTIKADDEVKPQEEPVPEEEEKEEVIKDEKTLYYESLTSKVELPSNKKQKKAPLKEGRKIPTEEELLQGATSCKLIDKEKYIAAAQNSGDLFGNYQSEFEKKESKVLETLRNLKKITDIKNMKKTNKIFLSGITLLAITGIGGLYYIEPDKHTFHNYKTSILSLAGHEVKNDTQPREIQTPEKNIPQEVVHVSEEEFITQEKEIQKEIQWQLNENDLGGYSLNFEILSGNEGQMIYKFEGIEYTLKTDLDEAIKNKLSLLKKEKILKYLRKK
ncbi:MAG: hypothetical protein GY828_04370 [Candidatus Gracilibacteria bacterium]|nr:hypothetical protein [Candidatus Gracilibacteria bacterium]